MTETENSELASTVAVPDIVVTKEAAMFWNAMNGGEETIKAAGTKCVVADVSYKNGIPESLIIEDYDPVANIAWLASLNVDDVRIVWKCPK